MAENDSKKNEPQSYGSQKEWVTGKTGGTVEGQSQIANEGASTNVESRHTSDESPGALGGLVSPVQASENIAMQGRAVDDDSPVTSGVTTSAEGAKRDSFFRKRDYSD